MRLNPLSLLFALLLTLLAACGQIGEEPTDSGGGELEEDCADEADDDGDGAVDCEDDDCEGDEACL